MRRTKLKAKKKKNAEETETRKCEICAIKRVRVMQTKNRKLPSDGVIIQFMKNDRFALGSYSPVQFICSVLLLLFRLRVVPFGYGSQKAACAIPIFEQ